MPNILQGCRAARMQQVSTTFFARRYQVASGFTLVELLVVIAIMGILISLLLPAVQQVRAASQRASCLNHLKQISLGMHSYHGANAEFPVGAVEWRGGGDKALRQLAWSAYLLPFVEQNLVFERLNLDAPFDSPQNETAAAALIDIYICPSGPRGAALVNGLGPADYGGIFGERINGPNNPPKGILIHDEAISIAEVTDGTSNTLIVAEDTGWGDGQWINGRNLFDQAFAINAAPKFENDMRSEHPRGANAARADGSVSFLSESTDLYVLGAMCTRAEGEIF